MKTLESIVRFCLMIVFGILKVVFWLLHELFKIIFKTKDHKLKATFSDGHEVLSIFNKGFCLTGTKSLSLKNSFQNVLVVGSVGTGKTSCAILPSLWRCLASVLIHDPSGEIFQNSAGYLHKKKGMKVQRLNYADPNVSDGYNPLKRVKTQSDIGKVASLIVRSSMKGNKGDPFWDISATDFIRLIITYVIQCCSPEYQNMANVVHLVNAFASNPKAIDRIFAKNASEKLFREYKNFIIYESKVMSNIVATARASLSLFQDEAVQQVTSHDSIDFSEFRKQKVALFINNSVLDMAYYSVLTSILFEQFWSELFKQIPDKDDENVFFLIDEASSLGLPSLANAIANIRKYKGGIMLVLQDFNQLIEAYGRYDAQTIKTNCFAQMYFTGQNLDVCRQLEILLGRYEYEDDKGNTRIRALMSADEIRTMPDNKALIIAGHHLPIRATLRPYYKNIFLRNKTRFAPPEKVINPSTQPIPLVPLDHQKKEV